MASLRTQLLVAAATLLTGIWAGGAVDRVIVGGPAWQELGAQAWAQYSRLADLGAGLVAYPIEGIGSTLLDSGRDSQSLHREQQSAWRDNTALLRRRVLGRRIASDDEGGTDHARPPRAPDRTCGPARF